MRQLVRQSHGAAPTSWLHLLIFRASSGIYGFPPSRAFRQAIPTSPLSSFTTASNAANRTTILSAHGSAHSSSYSFEGSRIPAFVPNPSIFGLLRFILAQRELRPLAPPSLHLHKQRGLAQARHR